MSSFLRGFLWVVWIKSFPLNKSADNLLNNNENSVVELENHELNEQLMLINQLDEDEKNALIKIINSMLTKKADERFIGRKSQILKH